MLEFESPPLLEFPSLLAITPGRRLTMTGKTTYSLLLAASLVVAAWITAPSQPPVLVAGSEGTLKDLDDDFLPDVVEWAVMTSATNPDTDNDQIPDFVEVVQRGRPRAAGVPLPVDHEARVVVTAPPIGTGGPTWLHLLFRFVGNAPNLTSLQTWLELPGYPSVQFPLSSLAIEQMVLQQRQTATEGLWVYVAVPLASESVVKQLLPCSLHAQVSFGSRVVTTGVKLFDVNGDIVSLVGFGDGYALQTIGVQSMSSSNNSNKVCVLDLQEAGSGPGGTVYEVMAADCEDCNELECSPSCPQSVGWLITLPGGLQGMFGR